MKISAEYIENLRTTINTRFTELARKEILFEEYWIKNQKCPCVSKLKKGLALNCKHINEALDERFGEEEKKLGKISLFVLKAKLYLNPKFPNNWL